MKPPVKVAITGAAGQIAYSLIFRVASGSMLGPDQPVILQLLEVPVPEVQEKLKGTVMEIEDCAFPLVAGIEMHSDPMTAFEGTDYALLVGARPRGPGMERKDLLTANGSIFGPQGHALSEKASRNVKVLVVGNPANTNAMIAANAATKLSPTQFHAMVRLDHNRAISQLASKTGTDGNSIDQMIIWGNHSSTQYPDIHHTTIGGKPATEMVSMEWVDKEFIPTVQQRGAAIIKARGLSSAASAASAAVDHMRDWALGSNGKWVSMGVPSDGSYGIAPGIVYGYPCICKDGGYEIVQGLSVNEFSRTRMSATEKELREEREAVEGLLK